MIGVSACLLGEVVRYDGSHKRDDLIIERLGCRFDLVPFCPEVAVGMGVPRGPIQLVGEPHAPRALGVEERRVDMTDRLDAYGREVVRCETGLCGFILKQSSPSCGLREVKVFDWNGEPVARGDGIFTRSLMENLPLLPLVVESDLADEESRERFCSRVQHYSRLRERDEG